MRLEKIDTIKKLMQNALKNRSITEKDAKIIIEDFLDSQIEGKLTHGLSKFLLIDSAISERVKAPEIKKEGPAFALVDGNREIGQIAAGFCIDLLVEKTKANGIAIVGMFNANRYSRLSVYGKIMAKSELVGIILNNGGPAAVTPYRGIDPIMGTNPICFAFPGRERELVIDFATSKKVWGEIRKAMLTKSTVPDNAFIDKNGNFTIDPEKVEAVVPFGEARGYALCLAIEILAGALVSAKMGLNVKSQYDLGFTFIGIDPTVFTDTEILKNQIDHLLTTIRCSTPQDESEPVLVPGDRSYKKFFDKHRSGKVEVDEEVFKRLVQMSENMDGGIVSNDKTD